MTSLPSPASPILNAMTVDVEEHFQVSGFDAVVPRASWAGQQSRVDANTARILDLLDERGVRGTFFVLGWLGERRPDLVRRIADRGHEIASHGFSHELVYRQDPARFREETRRSKRLLEDASGQDVDGYRAASFSIVSSNLWALDVLAEEGFRYDSSLFPVVHDRYGIPGTPRTIYRVKTRNGATLIEVPPSTISFGRFRLPVGGGGYLRIYPFALTQWALRRLNDVEGIPAVVYLHPWEVDPAQPRIEAPLKSRMRHYWGLRSTAGRLRDLVARHRFGTVREVIDASGELPEIAVEDLVATRDH